MPADSWIAPDDVPAFAADATARIDESLRRLTETDRDAFWASVRKCYNTPYNDPAPRRLPQVTVPLAPARAPSDPSPLSGLAAAVMAALPGVIPAGTQAA